MNYFGIDISKSWFDCFDHSSNTHQQFANDIDGWQAFYDQLPENSWVVMEASGPYYLGFASWLTDQQIAVSVVNPLVIRRYGQMLLSRTKTDAKDAQLIARYGAEQSLQRWTPPSKARQAMRQLLSLSEGFIRQRSIVLGQQEAFSNSPFAEELTMKLIDEQLARITDALKQIDRRLKQLTLTHFRDCYDAVTTIPGIGPKTAILLICLTDGFTKFDDGRKLASYVGICPRIYSSGSSTKGRGSICKLGGGQLRKALYMCSWTAKKCNPACQQMYQRMKQVGKPEKVIKVAIAHKLLRQALAVGKSGQPFDKKKSLAV